MSDVRSDIMKGFSFGQYVMKAACVLVLFGLVCVARPACAQWQQVTGSIFRSPSPFSGGAMIYKDGTLWAGTRDVWTSSDFGLMWSKTSLAPCKVYDIDAFDSKTAIVASIDRGLFLTQDGGQTWNTLLDSTYSISYVVFAGNLNTIIISDGGSMVRSSDLGKSWKSVSGAAGGGPLLYHRGLAYCVDTYTLDASTDAGLTWSVGAGKHAFDCKSLAADSCSPNIFYIMQEGLYSNSGSNVYITSDGGKTLVGSAANSNRYYTGNIAASNKAIYAQTFPDGVIRSLDRGLSWTTISGPPGQSDNRLIAIVNDSVLLVVDDSGQMWRTSNDGGNPIQYGGNWIPKNENPSPFLSDTLFACGQTVRRSFVIMGTCTSPPLDSIWITDSNSGAYWGLQVTHDSINWVDTISLNFSPNGRKKYDGSIDVSYHDGLQLGIPLGGSVRGPELISSNDTLFAGDSDYTCGRAITCAVAVVGTCANENLLVAKMIGADSIYYALDTITHDDNTGIDSVFLNFMPDSVRSYHALLQLIAGTDTTFSIALAGSGRPSIPAYLVSSDVMASDTIGGTVRVPILVHPNTGISSLGIRMTYDTALLVFSNIISNECTATAHSSEPGEQWLQLTFAGSSAQDDTIGYALFNYFPFDTLPTIVQFDSVSLSPDSPLCLSIQNASETARVHPNIQCGSALLSHFMRYDELPKIILQPNPSSQTVSIMSDWNIGSATIFISDAIGRIFYEGQSTLNPEAIILDVSNFPAGLYFVRVNSPGHANILSNSTLVIEH
jgi:photosystem II stability/assembly factor-like uncharacterized protein